MCGAGEDVSPGSALLLFCGEPAGVVDAFGGCFARYFDTNIEDVLHRALDAALEGVQAPPPPPMAAITVKRIRERADGVMEQSRELSAIVLVEDIGETVVSMISELDDMITREPLV